MTVIMTALFIIKLDSNWIKTIGVAFWNFQPHYGPVNKKIKCHEIFNFWQITKTFINFIPTRLLYLSYILWGNGSFWYPSAKVGLLENRWSTELYSLSVSKQLIPGYCSSCFKASLAAQTKNKKKLEIF